MIDKTNTALPVTDASDPDAEHACAYCDWTGGRPEDYHSAGKRRMHDYMNTDPVELCDFCYRSLAAEAFLAGVPVSTADPRDLAVFANMLLAEIRKLAPRETTERL